MIRYRNLIDAIGEDAMSDKRYCTDRYSDWEREVAEPRLLSKGWRVSNWRTGEGDSFGPLTRYAICISGTGKVRRFIYG